MPHLETASLGVWVGGRPRDERRRRARHLASARTHGVQGHAAAQRPRHRRGDRGGRRRSQRRDQHGEHRLLCRVLEADVPLALDVLSDILTESSSTATSWSARRASSCRRSARSRTRPTIWSSSSSTPRPFPISRSGARSSARRRQSRGFEPRHDPRTISTSHYRAARPSSARPARSIMSRVRRGRAALRRLRRAGATGAEPAARYSAATARSKRRARAGAYRHRLRGRVLRRRRLLRAAGLHQRARRRDVVAAVPGSAREARPGLLDLLLSLGLMPTPACSASMPAPAPQDVAN